jgi:hypothetical protein
MSKQEQAQPESQEIVIQQQPLQYVADRELPVVSLGSILKEMGISGPRVPAEQLVDQTFVILRGKAFQSSFNEQAHAWFCVCKDKQTGEVITTVLGGQAVVDILDALVQTGMTSPLEVTLRHVAGGRYSGYYVLE